MALLQVLCGGVAAAVWVDFNNTNAAVGAASKPSNTTKVVPDIGSHDPCADLCKSDVACSVWSWSPNSHHCYLRSDAKWDAEQWAGYWGGCDQARVPGCVEVPADARCPAGVRIAPLGPAPPSPPAARKLVTSVTVGSRPVAHADANFGGTGVNFDFWPPNKEKWAVSAAGGCGALDSDLTQSDLVYLAGQLNGSLLRLGGSPVDFLLYETPGTPLACTDAEVNRTMPPGGEFQPKTYFCPIWNQVNYRTSKGAHCLKAARWSEINSFALTTGLRIAFGLNACWLRRSADSDLDWTYVRAMVQQTAALAARNESAVWAWEFGNEVYGNVRPERYGADMARIRSLTDAAWAAAESAAGIAPGTLRRPLTVGPDNGLDDMSGASLDGILTAANGTMYAATFHDYGGDCSTAVPEASLALNVTCIDSRTQTAVAKFGQIAGDHDAALWYGEGALHANSGVAGLTNSFRSSLWYAHKLGSLLRSGVGLLSRQTLLGGDYELIDRITATPNPDYYVLLLWRRLIGTSVYDAQLSSPLEGLRVHAFDALGGGKVIVAVNFYTDAAVELSLPAAEHSVWQLTADPSSTRVSLNVQWGGAELVYTPGHLPAVDGHVVAGAVQLPPCSVTWMRH